MGTWRCTTRRRALRTAPGGYFLAIFCLFCLELLKARIIPFHSAYSACQRVLAASPAALRNMDDSTASESKVDAAATGPYLGDWAQARLQQGVASVHQVLVPNILENINDPAAIHDRRLLEEGGRTATIANIPPVDPGTSAGGDPAVVRARSTVTVAMHAAAVAVCHERDGKSLLGGSYYKLT